MNQKGFINIILIVLIVVLAGALGYVALVQRPTSTEQPQLNNQENTPSTPSPSNDTASQNLPPTQPPTTPPQSLPTTCTDEQEGLPVITSILPDSGPAGTKIEIKGCNFAGFEGDLNAWIENENGTRGVLYGGTGSNSNLIKTTLKSPLCQTDTSYSGLPCSSWLYLTPEVYKIHVMPWGKKSNEAIFMIK